MKRTEYIKQLKQLIKKYHPDLCTDEHLEAMYDAITKKLTNILNSVKTNETPNDSIVQESVNTENGANELIKIKDLDYIYYKSGMKYYRNIHPNQFYKRNSDRTYETKTYNELVSALNKIFLSFNLSEYYFRKVIDEYPQSPWFEDARDKIRLLKKLYKSYENMVLEENKTASYERFINEMGLKIWPKSTSRFH
jgi:hypothetical protein